jgi:predicted dehydrogenase
MRATQGCRTPVVASIEDGVKFVHRILIAGFGSIGRRHLRNLMELGIRDIMLLRRRNEPLTDARQFPIFTDLAKALENRPNVVIVSNPTAYHLQVALPAARAGCDLFIEKPLSNSWDGIEDLLSVVREKGLVAALGFDLRFDPGLCRVKKLLEEESIGQVIGIQAQVGQYLPDWHPGEDYREGVSARAEKGGGVILDLIHELDYVTWLLGPVAEIFCFAGKVSSLKIDTEDTAAMALKFTSGALGTIHLDYIQRAPSRTCKIVGEQGTIEWDYFGKKVLWYKPNEHTPERFEFSCSQRNDRFFEEMRHLLACLERKEQPKVDLLTGSRTLKLALAAKQSAATGEVSRLSQ